jgi:hypothetical protein
MSNPLGILDVQGLLAQCPCSGGGGARISYWVVLLLGATALLCGLVYDAYAQRRVKGSQSEEPEQPDGKQQHDEE